MKPALIIFARRPVEGKVKTRLAKTIGSSEALSVYRQLLNYTHSVLLTVDADRFVYYSDEIDEKDHWLNRHYFKRLQAEGDLGDKMKQAFDELFQMGYQKVIILGTDCPELESQHIQNAINELEEKDVVIGPAKDGGYYLLGKKKMIADLFSNKLWSTDQVFNQTLSDLERLNISYSLLSTLTDIDEEADWLPFKQKLELFK